MDYIQQDSLQIAFYDGRDSFRLLLIDNTGKIASETTLTDSTTTPLGSLWKLFVYIYLADNRIFPPPYICTGNHPDEVFCCQPGDSIQMDEALYHSCGLFFDPVRLGITSDSWKDYWTNTVRIDFHWLNGLHTLQPETVIPVKELLVALYQINKLRFALSKTHSVLSKVVLEGTAKGAVRHLGNTVKIKTFTWNHPSENETFIGGFAGWLNDGAAIWAAGIGTSNEILSRWSRKIAQYLDRQPLNYSKEFVKVRFFEQYPIEKIVELPVPKEANPTPATRLRTGPLNGQFRIMFKNGNSLEFRSSDNLYYEKEGKTPVIFGIFGVNDYVARVIDREIKTEPTEAAKAFAIVIRTYLVQNAKHAPGYFYIPDSTRFQRVSIHPPTQEAKGLSYWTDALVITGVSSVRYHQTRSSLNVLSWEHAKKLAHEGYYFDKILQAAYPGGKIGIMELKRNQECERLAHVESWLQAKSQKWRLYLMTKPGYEPLDHIAVCRLRSGSPYADFDENRIFTRSFQNIEDQITLTHEYLHLTFKNHPLGRDEEFIEQTAKTLVLHEEELYDQF